MIDKKDYYSLLAESKKKWNSIAKPIAGLGVLEDYVSRICAIGGSFDFCDISKKALVIMCADNGVVCEGVTQTGKEVTRIVAENFAAGHSSVNYMAKCAATDVYTIDIGMDTESYAEKQLVKNAVVDRKIARGTQNLAKQSAMTKNQCKKAIDTGIEIVGELKDKGYKIIATGEMGIGNTTPTTIMGAYMLDMSAEQATGRGAGLDDIGYKKKVDIVRMALERIKKEEKDIVDVITEVGCYEIAGMTGVYLGGVKYGIPIIMDGVISVISALAATYIDTEVEKYIIPSHISEEPLAQYALKALKQEAVLHAHMCLGEGTGAVALFPLLDMAAAVYNNMSTFHGLNIQAYKEDNKTVCKSIPNDI